VKCLKFKVPNRVKIVTKNYRKQEKMAETLQDIQIEEYLLNQHDFDLISKYTNEGQLDRALAKPIASVK
jgi:hypothetical protein